MIEGTIKFVAFSNKSNLKGRVIKLLSCKNSLNISQPYKNG